MTRGEGQWHKRKEKLALWQLLYAKRVGLTVAETARKYGVTPSLVCQKCKKYAVVLRQFGDSLRTCPVCETEFNPAAPNQRCCCAEHRAIYDAAQESE